MLFYPGVGTETLDWEYFVKKVGRAEVIKLPVKDFNGEYEKRSIFYISLLWIVGLLAMLTNSMIISVVWIWKIVAKKDFSFMHALWFVGRSSKHYSSPFVDLFCKFNHESKVHAASWRALDIFYNYREKIEPRLKNDLNGKFTRFWIEKVENRQAVANRRKIVTRLLVNSFKRFINEPEIRLVSIASGSAQAVIDAIKKVPNLKIRVKLIDNDPSAINEAKKEVSKAGLEESFEFIKGITNKLESACKDFQPHIVEMVGFLDYRPDKKAVRLMNRIKNQLCPRGIFLTCNIKKNREKILLDWILLWPMIYRTPEKFQKLIRDSGFAKEQIELYSCPFEIHTIAVCQN